MRKLRSVVAVASVFAVMACQTVAASSSVVRGVEPVVASQSATASSSAATQTQSQSRTTTANATVAASGSKRTWIIAGVIAAAALVVMVIALSMNGSEAVY